MTEPEWARWVLTAILAGVTVTCLLRLVSTAGGRPPTGMPRWHEDVGQAIMGASMIAMVLSWTDVLPKPLWVLLFGAQAIGFGTLLLRGHGGRGRENWDYTHHVMASAAMVYMVVAMSGPAMPGMAMSPLAGAFGCYFLIHAGWSVVRAGAGGVTLVAGEARLPAVLRQPVLVEGCRALMGGGMAFLLLAG